MVMGLLDGGGILKCDRSHGFPLGNATVADARSQRQHHHADAQTTKTPRSTDGIVTETCESSFTNRKGLTRPKVR